MVGFLIKSLLRQAYPASLFQVIVIPNHCTDDTAQAARAAGARVLECAEPTHCKGDVLRFAFRALASENFDGYCILDADNLAASGFLSAANDALCQGMEIAQGYRDSKNPSDSWVAGDTSLFFWMMSRFYNRARSALGMSAALNGTGIVLSRGLVERMGWNTCSLTEDLEFSAQCALNGVKIGFLPDAVIYDEQPVGLKDSMVQRRRWFSGTIQCFRHYGLSLLRTGSLQAMDMLAVFSGCVVQALGLISGLLTAVQLIWGLWGGTLQVQSLLLAGRGHGPDGLSRLRPVRLDSLPFGEKRRAQKMGGHPDVPPVSGDLAARQRVGAVYPAAGLASPSPTFGPRTGLNNLYLIYFL